MIYSIDTRYVVHETLDGEVIAVHLKMGRYYSLADSAALIWFAIAENLDEEAIADHLSQRYVVETLQAKEIVSAFLTELASNHLIFPNPAATPGELQLEPAPRVELAGPILDSYTDMEALLLLDPVHDAAEEGWPAVKA
jgi:hypothetical protein